jgi:hypothetical protein
VCITLLLCWRRLLGLWRVSCRGLTCRGLTWLLLCWLLLLLPLLLPPLPLPLLVLLLCLRRRSRLCWMVCPLVGRVRYGWFAMLWTVVQHLTTIVRVQPVAPHLQEGVPQGVSELQLLLGADIVDIQLRLQHLLNICSDVQHRSAAAELQAVHSDGISVPLAVADHADVVCCHALHSLYAGGSILSDQLCNSPNDGCLQAARRFIAKLKLSTEQKTGLIDEAQSYFWRKGSDELYHLCGCQRFKASTLRWPAEKV